MYTIVRIEGDPNSWIVHDAQAEAMSRELAQPGGPVTLPVLAPLQGRLVLSAKSAGSVALLKRPDVVGWLPSYIRVPSEHLYVPTGWTGPTSHAPGYKLAQSADLAALERDIVAAMSGGSLISVEVSDGILRGSLLLNGAALRLAVLCPPSPGS